MFTHHSVASYYFIAAHKEYSGGSQMQISMHMYETDYTSKEAEVAVNERQRIVTSSTAVPEKQVRASITIEFHMKPYITIQTTRFLSTG